MNYLMNTLPGLLLMGFLILCACAFILFSIVVIDLIFEPLMGALK